MLPWGFRRTLITCILPSFVPDVGVQCPSISASPSSCSKIEIKFYILKEFPHAEASHAGLFNLTHPTDQDVTAPTRSIYQSHTSPHIH